MEVSKTLFRRDELVHYHSEVVLLLFTGGVGRPWPGSLQTAALLAGRSHGPGLLSVRGVLHQPLTAGTN